MFFFLIILILLPLLLITIRNWREVLSLAWYVSCILSSILSFIPPIFTESSYSVSVSLLGAQNTEIHTYTISALKQYWISKGRKTWNQKTIKYMQETMGVSRRWWADLWGHIRENFIEKVTFGLNIKVCWRCHLVEHKSQGLVGRWICRQRVLPEQKLGGVKHPNIWISESNLTWLGRAAEFDDQGPGKLQMSFPHGSSAEE